MQYVMNFRAMGCQVNIWLDTLDDGTAVLQHVPGWVEDLEACLSRFRPQSELSQLNTQVGEWVQVSDTLLSNILAAKQGARLTGGLYNPLILDALVAAGYDRSFEQLQPQPSREPVRAVRAADWRGISIDIIRSAVKLPAPIDLGGVAKGWTARYIAEKLAVYGSCLVDMGGDIALQGAPAGEAGWEIGVAEPGEIPRHIVRVMLQSGSIVTSGTDYRRWLKGDQLQHHLIDPRTGLPAQTDVVSATVIHPHAPTAEVYAKAILLLGSEAGLAWINQQWERAALIVRADGAVLATDAFQNFIVEGVTV